jgi:ribose-phosphate pyrophosphokinase
MSKLILFALDASRAFGERVAARLGTGLAPHEERSFDGGEHKCRALAEVGGRDVYVIQALHGEPQQSANDKLVRLLFFIGALRDAGAARVTAVTPYLAYARKDRRTKPRDPVSIRYLAQLFESVGTDRIVTVEVHNVSAFENAFHTCRTEHVPVAGLLSDHFAARLGDRRVAVVSPDTGGDKRAELFRHELEKRLGRAVGKAIMDKHRSMGVVSGSLFAGDVEGRLAIVVDDLISSGTTLVRAAQACRNAGASGVVAAAPHGLFTDGARALFGGEGPDEIVVADTIPLPPLASAARGKIRVVEVSGLVGDVIGRLHRGEVVSDILPYD